VFGGGQAWEVCAPALALSAAGSPCTHLELVQKSGIVFIAGLQAAQKLYEAGTGCLEKCQAGSAKQELCSQDFCDGLDVWKCSGAPAPCSGALPASSAPVGVVNPFSAPSEAPGPNAGAV
jgi:hypothetical protein